MECNYQCFDLRNDAAGVWLLEVLYVPPAGPNSTRARRLASPRIPNLPFTFSAWVNPAGFTDWRAIISKRDNSAAANMRMDMGLSGGSGPLATIVAPAARLETPPQTLGGFLIRLRGERGTSHGRRRIVVGSG